MVGGKGSLVKAIIPSDDTQPPTCLLRDELLPYKLVITFKYTLPYILRGLIVNTLLLVSVSHKSQHSMMT